MESAVAFCLIALLSLAELGLCRDIIYAVNCGGDSHTDSSGIHYSRDKHTEGTTSDFGKRMQIARAAPGDQVLYQTERYHFKTFSYSIPLNREGNYVLVLKFAEVYFSGAGQKVFDVHLNGEPVITEMDIFGQVGKGIAHDEYVVFSVKSGQLSVNGNSVAFDGKLTVSFVRGSYDNPKCNAFYILRGTPNEVPRLPEISEEQEDDVEEEETDDSIAEERQQRHAQPQGPSSTFQKKSGKPKRNPYESDSMSWITPVAMALAVVVPLVFCLCRL